MEEKYAIYVHIPFCKARCGYCAFSSCCDYSLLDTYFDKLAEEMEYYSDKSVKISTVYIGGGTPSSVGAEYLEKVFSSMRKNFNVREAVEITVECNPESASKEILECLKKNGVNRLSFGLQSANDATLKKIGRLHDLKKFESALELAKDAGFDNVNVDLILGLPESAEDFYRSVRYAAKLPVTHVSVYALEVYRGSPISKLCVGDFAYDRDALADMYDEARGILAANGFTRYETSNFCKKGKECKHNLNYWREGRYFAFGASASGFVRDCRYVEPREIHGYLLTPVERLRDDFETVNIAEQASEYVMLSLRLDEGVSLCSFERRFQRDFFESFPNARKLINDGFLVCENGRVFVPSDKFYVVNSILCELL